MTDKSVFKDSNRHTITITEADLLGTHTYENVLYTGSTDVVNVLSGETPQSLDRSVAQATAFVEDTETDGRPPRVAKKQPPERAVESRSPYVSSAFFHYSITGGMDWHTVFRRAWESDAYDVTPDPDYETGTLTITVTKQP